MFKDSILSEIHNELDYISSDKFLNFCKNNNDSFTYLKTDNVFNGCTWRNHNLKPVWREYLTKTITTNVILGHSDLDVTKEKIFLLRALGARRVLTSNLRSESKICNYIPLGLTNDSNESVDHKIMGNTSILRETYLNVRKPNFKNLIFYRNYSTKNNWTVRSNLDSILKNEVLKNKVVFRETKISIEGRKRYLNEVREYGLVLCPKGNGYDSHRIWETLYLGGIPIVKIGELPMKFPNSDQIPILKVKDWNEILDLTYIEAEVARILSVSHDSRYLSYKYQSNILEQLS
jgi:hypothetical protein